MMGRCEGPVSIDIQELEDIHLPICDMSNVNERVS